MGTPFPKNDDIRLVLLLFFSQLTLTIHGVSSEPFGLMILVSWKLIYIRLLELAFTL